MSWSLRIKVGAIVVYVAASAATIVLLVPAPLYWLACA